MVVDVPSVQEASFIDHVKIFVCLGEYIFSLSVNMLKLYNQMTYYLQGGKEN
jgi:hypothetical protein